MFQCYLDDSGTSGLPIVALGGFVGHATHWEFLEPVMDEILCRYEVPVFHAKEFHDTKPPFKGWKRLKKRSFAEEIFTATHRRIAGYSVAIKSAQFEQAKQEQDAWDNMSAIGVCFSSIMVRIVTDPQLGPAVKREGLSFLIETGNRNNGEIDAFFAKMAAQPVFEGCLRSVSFIPKASCRPIQLADFFVFYSRRHLRNQARFDGKLALPSCPYLTIMSKYGPIWQNLGRGAPRATGSSIGKDLLNLDDLSALTNKKA